jgi:DnaJ domain
MGIRQKGRTKAEIDRKEQAHSKQEKSLTPVCDEVGRVATGRKTRLRSRHRTHTDTLTSRIMEEDPSIELFDEQPPALYETLGLDKGASEKEIRTAYRRRALLSHPDKLTSSLSDEERDKEGLKFRRVSLRSDRRLRIPSPPRPHTFV